MGVLNGGLELANASQLAEWANLNSREAQDRLPELIRKLLSVTPGASEISIRAGDGVALSGRDGTVRMATPSTVLPAGEIWFEFGTSKNIKQKADKDYEARKSEARKDVTFVFVTSRRWQGKDSWAAHCNEDGLYKDVKVLDADDLETWLDVTPTVHVWVSELLGLNPQSAISLERWWDDFSRSTNPRLPSNLFIAGRDKEAKGLIRRISPPSSLITIQTEWSLDGFGFVYSALKSASDTESEIITLIKDPNVWGRIVRQPAKGILIPDFDDATITDALENGWSVVTIVDKDNANRRDICIQLPRIDRNKATEVFSSAGVDHIRAHRYGVAAARNLKSFIRTISSSPRVKKPEWARPPLGPILASLMLVNRWSDEPEDRECLEELTSIPYSKLCSVILQVSNGSEPVIRNVGNTYYFTSLDDTYLQLLNRVSNNLAEKWHKIAVTVLLAPDPNEGLGYVDAAVARNKGIKRRYSKHLRQGIAESLAAFGAISADSTEFVNLENVPKKIVSELISCVTNDLHQASWTTIASELPLLAEAAPDVFLDMLEDDLTSPNPSIRTLFTSSSDSELFGGNFSASIHLKAALERLCWSSVYLVRSVQVMTKLCEFEKGEWGDFWIESISSVISGWVRNTEADLPTKLDALNACRLISKARGWQVLKELWPREDLCIPVPSLPQYRIWKPETTQPTPTETDEFKENLVQRALDWAGTDRANLSWLVEAQTHLDHENAALVIQYLKSLVKDTEFDANLKCELLAQTITTVIRHERFESARWAMDSDRVEQLRDITAILEPDDRLRRCWYLLNSIPNLKEWPQSPDRELTTKDWKFLDSFFSRVDAWERFEEILRLHENPEAIGVVLARHENSDFSRRVLPWFNSENKKLNLFATAWSRSFFAINDEPGLIKDILSSQSLSREGRDRFVLSIPSRMTYIDTLKKFPSAYSLYFSKAILRAESTEDLPSILDELNKQGRVWHAIEVAAMSVLSANSTEGKPLPEPSLICAVLSAPLAMKENHDKPHKNIGYSIRSLLDHLDHAGMPINTLLSLEFFYAPTLKSFGGPAIFSRTLDRDASVFAALVTLEETGFNSTESRDSNTLKKANRAYMIRTGWTGFAGKQDDGSLNKQSMREWVGNARAEISQNFGLDKADVYIGQAFAHSPVDDDGIWPPISVRELIDELSSPAFERGLVMGRRNSRGVSVRLVGEGSKQEEALTYQYDQWAQKTQGCWPRTSSMLRRISQKYRSAANSEDTTAQLEQDDIW